jgi:hypothetical protein
MYVPCPGCGRAIELEPHEIGLTVECARCGQRFETKPARPPTPPPEVHWHIAPAPTPAPDPFDFEREEPPRRPRGDAGTDAPGMISLVFGCVAGVMLLIAPVTCGMTAWVALALSLVGGCISFFGRGNLRIGALTLNLLVFVFSLLAAALIVAVAVAADRGR